MFLFRVSWDPCIYAVWSRNGRMLTCSSVSPCLMVFVQVYKLPSERIYATYFGGDEKSGLPADNEARDLWLKFLPPSRVLPFDCKVCYRTVSPICHLAQIHHFLFGAMLIQNWIFNEVIFLVYLIFLKPVNLIKSLEACATFKTSQFGQIFWWCKVRAVVSVIFAL